MKHVINRNFTAFAAGSLTLSMATGYALLCYVQSLQQHEATGVLDSNNSHLKSREELRIKAMVENAKESKWQENLTNAFLAQERFMLPGRDHGADPKFVKKIECRTDELLKQQYKKQKKIRDTTQENFEPESKIQFW